MTEEEHQKAREERRRGNRLYMAIAVGVIAGAFALLALAASWVVVRSANERQQICISAARERDVLRDVLIFARDRALSSGDLDSFERDVVRSFYAEALARAPAIQCSDGSIERR